MTYQVTLVAAQPRHLAVATARVAADALTDAIPGLLDQAFVAAAAAGVAQSGPVVVVYRGKSGGEVELEAGFEVAAPFPSSEELASTQTPAGPCATTQHVGDQAQLQLAHWAIHDWCREEERAYADAQGAPSAEPGVHWEVYEDWSDAPEQLTAEVFYLLAP